MQHNKRSLVDAALSANVALPNAANTVNTPAIDLGNAEPFPVEKFQIRIKTSLATGANSKNINISLQASNEAAANFVNVSGLPPIVLTVTDAAGAGYAAAVTRVTLPPGFVKRYIRLSATGEANGGNAADGTLEAAVVV
jgi:hypothetical protein